MNTSLITKGAFEILLKNFTQKEIAQIVAAYDAEAVLVENKEVFDRFKRTIGATVMQSFNAVDGRYTTASEDTRKGQIKDATNAITDLLRRY
jgi:hypothetical protein